MSNEKDVLQLPVPPHTAAVIEELLQRIDRQRQATANLTQRFNGIVLEQLTARGLSVGDFRYDRERRVILLKEAAENINDATQETRS